MARDPNKPFILPFVAGCVIGAASMWVVKQLRKNGSSDEQEISAVSSAQPLFLEHLIPLEKPPSPTIRENIGVFHKAYLLSRYDVEEAMSIAQDWKDFMEIDTILVEQIAKGDNVLTDVELNVLRKTQKSYGMEDDHIEEIIAKYKDRRLTKAEWDEQIRKPVFERVATKLGRSTDRHLSCMTLSSLEVAYADGLAEDEAETALQIVKDYGVDEERALGIVEMLRASVRLLQLYEKLI